MRAPKLPEPQAQVLALNKFTGLSMTDAGEGTMPAGHVLSFSLHQPH